MNMQLYTLYTNICNPSICKICAKIKNMQNMQKYAKICIDPTSMQNMQKSALPTLLMMISEHGPGLRGGPGDRDSESESLRP